MSFPAHFGRAGYDTALIGKAHFATSHTFKPTGTLECRQSAERTTAPDWFGPYFGFDHVELMVEGHNNWPPMKPPQGQHYERWYHQHQGGRDGGQTATRERHCTGTKLPPGPWAALKTWNSALPVAWHNSTWVGNRTIEYLHAHRGDSGARPFCLWASSSPIRIIHSTVPSRGAGCTIRPMSSCRTT